MDKSSDAHDEQTELVHRPVDTDSQPAKLHGDVNLSSTESDLASAPDDAGDVERRREIVEASAQNVVLAGLVDIDAEYLTWEQQFVDGSITVEELIRRTRGKYIRG